MPNYRSDEIYDLLEAYRQKPPVHIHAELEGRVQLAMRLIRSSATQLQSASLSLPPLQRLRRWGTFAKTAPRKRRGSVRMR